MVSVGAVMRVVTTGRWRDHNLVTSNLALHLPSISADSWKSSWLAKLFAFLFLRPFGRVAAFLPARIAGGAVFGIEWLAGGRSLWG